jgi:iron complex outermembrane receptor protein
MRACSKFMVRRSSCPVALGLATLLLHHGAAAQQDNVPAVMERVQVTGSRLNLQQARISGVGPVTVIDADAIERSGAVSLETLLQRLPASAGAAGNQGNAYWTLNGFGTAQVNLRGLGINRTLVLLNGRRVVAGGTGANSAVDLNMIPVAMIERIEVLKDGASAVYGADALAGVVNIITRNYFDGAQLATRYGQTARGDGEQRAADLVWGARGAHGALMASLHYARSGDVSMASRVPCGMIAEGGTLVCSGGSSTIGGRARLADGTRVNFNQDPNGDPRAYAPYSAALHGYNSNDLLKAVNPIERLGVSVFGRARLNEQMEFFGEFILMNRHSSQQATPGTIGTFRPITIAATHPGNPTGQDLLLERRRIAEAGPRVLFQETNTARIVSGVKGALSGGWDWSASLNWGRNTGVEGTNNIINLDRVDATLNLATCGGGPAAAPCGNYLGYGNLSPAVLDYIHTTARDHGGNDQRSITASISGALFTLPAGPVSFASGVELRQERGWRDPDPLIVSRAANTNPQDPVAGQYSARELFVELSAPLIDTLHVNAAARHSRYSLFGASNTFKLGVDWQIAAPLKLRVNRSTALRVPTVSELFGGISQGSLSTTDPCNNWNALSPDSVVYKNCRASGVPAGYRQLGPVILTTGGGNIGLQPEDADTLTAGLVWTRGKDLTLTIDYFDIRINEAIEAVSGSTKLAVCYNSPDLSHVFCRPSSFRRDAQTGDINFLSSQAENVARQRISGIDLGALVGFGWLGWHATWTADVARLQRFDVTPFPGSATIAYAGKITGGRGSYAHWRSLTSLTLVKGAASGAYSVQYIGAANDINAVPANLGARAPGILYHNASAKYALSKAVSVSLSIDNLFNRKAPFIQSWVDGNTDTNTYELLGRRWQLRLAYRF